MNCKDCPFKEGTRVHGEGCITKGEKVLAVKEERNYDVVAVGMAPAREEVEQGRPFVGVSGQILRKHLFQLGIEEYYVCNVLLCPITNDRLVTQAIRCCRNVVEEVRDKKPKLTIALGDLPLHTLAPDIKYTIKECEGRIIPSLVGPLLPLTHPAFYWRNPDQIFDFTECMRSGIRFLSGDYTQAEDPTLEVVTKDNYQRVLNELDRHEDLAVDLETTGFHAYGWDPAEIMEMGLAADSKHAYIVPRDLIPEFKQLLEEKRTRWWNAQFDCAFLRQIGIYPNPHFDGMLAHYSIDERPYSHGLKRVSQIYLGTEDWEKDIDRYLTNKKTSSYADIPTSVRYEYLSKDVTRTYQLCDVLDKLKNTRVFDKLLMPACRMFIGIQEKGQRVDPVKMMDMDRILEREMHQVEKTIYEETGSWINPSSPKQVSELIYNKLGLPVDPFFGFSTSKAYLMTYRDSHPIINMILDYRELSKLKGGYIGQFAKFVDKNFRIHPYIKLMGSVTGRLASADPSIMNVRSLKDFRRIFIPSEGSIFGYYDVKQNELRWYCVYSRDEELSAILRNGGDPHNEVAIAAYGKDKAKELRGLAKAVVFGRIYQRGDASIERQVGREVLGRVLEAVDGIAPNIGNYYKDIMRKVRSQGYLESYFGRKRRFSLITYDNKHKVERQAVNFPIQSAGSDLMLLCMLRLWEIKDELGIFPFWPVHDSITLEIPDVGTLYKVKKELETYSLEIVNGVMPFVWEEDWGYNWALDKEPPKGRKVEIDIDELERSM